MKSDYTLVSAAYHDTSQVPRYYDLFYHCKICDVIIPSVPDDNLGCDCGNIYIDKDYWRLVVIDFEKFEVLRKALAIN